MGHHVIAGTRALITGASRGIGADLARGLRRSGADVALVARGAEELGALATELGGKAYPTDLTDRTAMRELLDRVEIDGDAGHRSEPSPGSTGTLSRLDWNFVPARLELCPGSG